MLKSALRMSEHVLVRESLEEMRNLVCFTILTNAHLLGLVLRALCRYFGGVEGERG